MGRQGERPFTNFKMIFHYYFVQASKRHVDEAIAKQIHDKVAPFVNWLRTAEEESSDEDEEDELEVVYSQKAMGTEIVTENVDEAADVSL